MTARQPFSFSTFSAAIDRPHSVDHVFCGQLSAGCDDGLSRRQTSNLAHNLSAFSEDLRSAAAVNGAIHSPSTKKRRVRRINDGIGRLAGNVGRAPELNRPLPLQHQSNCKVLHARIQTGYFLSVSASTPGSFLPSRNSSDAPPPVEICVILSATSAPCTAATVSPPPTIETAPTFSATACATLNVPRENPGTSKTPIGPFHTIVRAREISSENSSIVFGPMSSAMRSAGIGWPSPICCTTALASGFIATTWSM